MADAEERPIPHELTPGEQLYRMSEQTNDDGTVNVEVLEWEKEGDYAAIEAILPTGDTFSVRMDWPECDSDEYEFIRLLRKAGIGPVQAEALEGEEVPAKRVGSSWELDTSEPQTRLQRTKSKVLSIGFSDPDEDEWSFWQTLLHSAYLFPLIFVLVPLSDDVRSDDAEAVAITLWILSIWAILLGGAAGVFFLL